MDLTKGEIGKSRLAAKLATMLAATMLAGYKVIYGGAPNQTPRRKVNTHPMITASDSEIRKWNANVKTRQVLRFRFKPWRYPHREWRTML